MKKKTDFRKNIQKIIDRGLSRDVALAALTTYPSEAMGVEKVLGKIQPGFMANLVVTDGDFFNPKTRVTSLWLAGKEYFVAERFKPKLEGEWELNIEEKSYVLSFTKVKSRDNFY